MITDQLACLHKALTANKPEQHIHIHTVCMHSQLVCVLTESCVMTITIALQEITRRVNLQDIWQAAYTAGVVLPKPVAQCRLVRGRAAGRRGTGRRQLCAKV